MPDSNPQDFQASIHHFYPGFNPALRQLVPEGARVILDVGCGAGGTAQDLSSGGIVVDGITWSEEEAEIARRHCRQVVVADVSGGLPQMQNGQYDCVICSHLLEHIAYPHKLLADIKNVLVENGSLIVAIPNLFFWEDRLKLMLGRWDYMESGTFDYTHLRWYTHDTMPALIKTLGFKLDAFVGDGWFPFPGLRILIGSHKRRQLNRLVAQRLPGLFAKQLVYLFTKTT